MNPTRLRISNSFPSGFDGLYTFFKNVEPSFAVALSMFNAGNIVISAGPLDTSNPIDRHRRNEKAKGTGYFSKVLALQKSGHKEELMSEYQERVTLCIRL
jgi:hypothetical protein